MKGCNPDRIMHCSKRVCYVANRAGLDEFRNGIKFLPCPHCGKTGFLICYGYMMGYGQKGAERIVRGGRFLCSNRHRRHGCGRTFPVLLAEFMKNRIVPASTLWKFLEEVQQGKTRHAAWYRVGSPFSIDTGYRLWAQVRQQQSRIRALLRRLKPPPKKTSANPVFQMIRHLRSVFPAAPCPIAAFQLRFQCSFLP